MSLELEAKKNFRNQAALEKEYEEQNTADLAGKHIAWTGLKCFLPGED